MLDQVDDRECHTKTTLEVGDQEVYVSSLIKMDAEMGGTADLNTLRYVMSGMSMEDARE